MSLISQVTNINQNMHIPAHIVAEHLASMKFADEFAKIAAKEKRDKVEEVRKVEEIHEIDTNITKDSQKEYAKDTIRHIDIKG